MNGELDLEDFIQTTVAQACNVDRETVRPDTPLLDLNIDSLALVSVFAQVEAVYDLELTPDEILSMLEAPRVSDLVTCLRELVASR